MVEHFRRLLPLCAGCPHHPCIHSHTGVKWEVWMMTTKRGTNHLADRSVLRCHVAGIVNTASVTRSPTDLNLTASTVGSPSWAQDRRLRDGTSLLGKPLMSAGNSAGVWVQSSLGLLCVHPQMGDALLVMVVSNSVLIVVARCKSA